MKASRAIFAIVAMIVALVLVIAVAGYGATNYVKGPVVVTPGTTTGVAYKIDPQATLTSGTILQLILDSDVATTGKFLDLLGGTNHATSVLAIGKTGEITGTGPKQYTSVPLTLTANATAITGVFVAQRAMTITKGSIAFAVKPASAAGTITLALANYDLSATADDNLLSAATIDLEALTAKTASDLTLTATGADLVLAAGDYVYATIVSNNVDAVGGGGVITLEYTLQ
jgi:hypothetical protein